MVNGLAMLGKSLSFFQARSKRDKDVARVIIAELNGRDTVHARVCNEHCRATYESVRGLRAAVNAQLGREMSTDLAFVLLIGRDLFGIGRPENNRAVAA